jgi:hypothetical protein
MTATNQSILISLLLAGLLGLIGQSIRVIVGLKKLRDEAAAEAQKKAAGGATEGAPPSRAQAKASYNELFDARKLWLSLFIGFIAGCLAGLAGDYASGTAFSREAILAMVGAGYAGTDFIEGVFKKLLPGS